MSVRSCARLGASLSVVDFTHLGASVSLRAFARLGSTVSLLDFAHMGATMSIRSFARLGSAMSVLDFALFGASISMRSYSRVGENLSVFDTTRTHDFKSEGTGVFNTMSGGFIGASKATFTELTAVQATVQGSLLAQSGAVMGTNTGSTVIWDGLAGQFATRYETATGVNFMHGTNKRLQWTSTGGSLHGAWTTDTPFTFSHPTLPSAVFKATTPNKEASIEYDAARFTMKVEGTRVLSMTPLTAPNTPSALHGEWVADVLTFSDRRLKRDIKDLTKGLRGTSSGEVNKPSWVLRQLRPVSFRFKTEGSPEYDRYGFLADEVAAVLPEIVREVNTDEGPALKAVAYQDLIAVAVAAQQVHGMQLDDVTARLSAQEEQIRLLWLKVDALLNEVQSQRRPSTEEGPVVV